MSALETPQLRTVEGTPYTTRANPDNSLTISVPNIAAGRAAKRVKRNGAGWGSLDGQQFPTIHAVADGMRWAL